VIGAHRLKPTRWETNRANGATCGRLRRQHAEQREANVQIFAGACRL